MLTHYHLSFNSTDKKQQKGYKFNLCTFDEQISTDIIIDLKGEHNNKRTDNCKIGFR